MKRIKQVLAAAGAAFLLVGCGFLKPAKSTLDKIESRSPCMGTAKTLIVLLPGRFDAPDDFLKQGFIDALRARRIDADVIMPDLHFGYYREKSVVVRLHADAIDAARARGYAQIWLAGVSLGGLGSLLYAQEHAERLRGMLLIAPYLGEQEVHQEIRAAGGLKSWSPAQIGENDFARRLWVWLRDQAGQPATEPVVYLGYGIEDGFAPGNALLASALPADRVMTAQGGHDWQPWLRIWERFLDKGLLPACAR